MEGVVVQESIMNVSGEYHCVYCWSVLVLLGVHFMVIHWAACTLTLFFHIYGLSADTVMLCRET